MWNIFKSKQRKLQEEQEELKDKEYSKRLEEAIKKIKTEIKQEEQKKEDLIKNIITKLVGDKLNKKYDENLGGDKYYIAIENEILYNMAIKIIESAEDYDVIKDYYLLLLKNNKITEYNNILETIDENILFKTINENIKLIIFTVLIANLKLNKMA